MNIKKMKKWKKVNKKKRNKNNLPKNKIVLIYSLSLMPCFVKLSPSNYLGAMSIGLFDT